MFLLYKLLDILFHHVCILSKFQVYFSYVNGNIHIFAQVNEIKSQVDYQSHKAPFTLAYGTFQQPLDLLHIAIAIM